MEDHIEVIHNKSFVEGLSLENNLIYIISKFLTNNPQQLFRDWKETHLSFMTATNLFLNWPTLGIIAND